MDHYTPFSPKPDPDTTPPAEVPDETDLDAQPTADEKQARLDYVKSIAPQRPPQRTWLRVVIGVVILIMLLGIAAYLYNNQHGDSSKSPAKKATGNTSQVAPSSTGASTTTTHYVSNGSDLNLSFDYPDNWTVTPASGGNTNDGTITLNSPLVTIASAAGTSTTGKVTVMIRPSSATLTELSSGQAAAAQDSVQFAYTKPTSAQYQYPYLTFIHLTGGSNPTSAFEEVLVTGTRQFTKGTSITESSVAVDPIVTASFYSCTASACTGAGAAPLSITNDTWTSGTVFQQTLTLIESLQLN